MRVKMEKSWPSSRLVGKEQFLSMPADTHCLITMSRARTQGAPALLLLDTQACKVKVLRLPADLPPASAITGVTASDTHLFLVVQLLSRPEPYFYNKSFFLLILDRVNLAMAGLHPL